MGFVVSLTTAVRRSGQCISIGLDGTFGHKLLVAFADLAMAVVKLPQPDIEWHVIVSPFLEWYRLQQPSAESGIDKPTSIVVGQAHEKRQ